VNGEEKFKPASIKMTPLSNNYQTYERCIVLAQDMDIMRTDIEKDKESYMPYRVVVNNSTFSIFEGVDYQKVSESFPLNSINIEDT